MLSDTYQMISALDAASEDYIIGNVHSSGLSQIVLTMRKGNLSFSLPLERFGN
jgi:hypothetical protein